MTNEAAPGAVARDDRPFGIAEQHLRPPSRRWVRAALIVVLTVPLLAALLGFLGGGDATLTTARSDAARLSVETPGVLRSGNWFETRIVVVPRRDVADLTVAIDRPLWRRLSIDTLAPDAESAESRDGTFRYAFGPVKAGESFDLKLDGQIQSWGLRRLRGDVTVLDGEQPLAQVPLAITVLP